MPATTGAGMEDVPSAAPATGVGVAGRVIAAPAPSAVAKGIDAEDAEMAAVAVGAESAAGGRSETVGAGIGVAIEVVVVTGASVDPGFPADFFDFASEGFVVSFVVFDTVFLLTLTRRAPSAWLEVAISPVATASVQAISVVTFDLWGIGEVVLMTGLSSPQQTNRERLGVALLNFRSWADR